MAVVFDEVVLIFWDPFLLRSFSGYRLRVSVLLLVHLAHRGKCVFPEKVSERVLALVLVLGEAALLAIPLAVILLEPLGGLFGFLL